MACFDASGMPVKFSWAKRAKRAGLISKDENKRVTREDKRAESGKQKTKH